MGINGYSRDKRQPKITCLWTSGIPTLHSHSSVNQPCRSFNICLVHGWQGVCSSQSQRSSKFYMLNTLSALVRAYKFFWFLFCFVLMWHLNRNCIRNKNHYHYKPVPRDGGRRGLVHINTSFNFKAPREFKRHT